MGQKEKEGVPAPECIYCRKFFECETKRSNGLCVNFERRENKKK